MTSATIRWSLLVFTFSIVALQSGGQNANEDVEDSRQGRGFLDWIGLGTGPDTDPYLARTNAACLNGDLAECFKSRALVSLDEFFAQPFYQLTENARLVRMPETQLRSLAQEPYQFTQAPRADEPEWDQLVKFVMRKVEKFLKSTAIEADFTNDITESGRYSPRFVDEIADEIDIIEDKKDSLFNRKQLKKLFIPMLIILKLFKLKLLLFLPLILGLASFKKLLGFLAIVIPGLIGYFKLCKPNLSSPFASNNYHHAQYSPAGIGYQPHYKNPYGNEEYNYYDDGRKINFGESAHELAYNGYGEYRSKNSGIQAETSSKKSILPDS
ncbi:uncharacterized protein [Onthophagus taurus]|uniref:uncharacterized protein n=1 Tax=Onthophagus taurus TaxID=166361 RepID=UPI000C206986|nr:uncharacterized protein LOC111427543 [Onthophagus taurus]